MCLKNAAKKRQIFDFNEYLLVKTHPKPADAFL